MQHPRFVLNGLLQALQDTPVVFVRGPRQTGKSTLMRMLQQHKPEAVYTTLDDLTTLGAARSDPRAFLQQTGTPLIVDEAQRAPELFLIIKALIDAHRQPGQFVLTGSADVLFFPHVADSLAGRMEVLTLHPLATSELQGQQTPWLSWLFDTSQHKHLLAQAAHGSPQRQRVLQHIVCGGYPEIHKRALPHRRQAWFRSYVTALLQRDARDIMQLTSLHKLDQLLRLLATRTGCLLNTQELSRTSSIAASTLRRYFTLLQTLFLVHTLPPWSTNQSKRLVKAEKIYGEDTGLTCHLLGLDAQGLADSAYLGHLLETFVVNELRKHAGWESLPVQLYHYRTAAGREVDVVLQADDGRVVGLEIKASSHVTSQDFAGLRHLSKLVGEKWVCGAVLYLGQQPVSFAERLYALPLMFS